ncbi:MAG: efflux RND transporter periplasmic adaptor subunit [Deltaproteobacteria bacterium]|nr:efflux RND transporter periplasmic adaptor subunit [Deltaproteobacteria bacterium]
MQTADDQTQPRNAPQLESVGTIEAPPIPEHAKGGRKLWFAVGAAVVVAGGLAFGVLGHTKHEAAPVVRDVPTRDGDFIVYSPAFAQRAGIKITEVKRAPLVPTVRVVGTVSFDPGRVAAVGTRLRAVVRRTMKFEGDEVKAGDVLAELDSAELGEAQANVITNKAQAEAARVNAQREKSLLDQQLTTAREAEIAETTARSQVAMLSASEQRVRALGGAGVGALGATVLRSPIEGHVVGRFVEPGQAVEANVTAYKIADLSRLWIELAVTETNLGTVRIADKVTVAPVSDPTKTIVGKVAHVGEVIDLSTRTADVRVEVDNSAHVLRVGQSVFATIDASGPAHEGLLIPRDAVVFVDGKPTVFRAEGANKVVPVVVKLGASNETDYEVLDGLKDGAKVVQSGAFYLKSELFR